MLSSGGTGREPALASWDPSAEGALRSRGTGMESVPASGGIVAGLVLMSGGTGVGSKKTSNGTDSGLVLTLEDTQEGPVDILLVEMSMGVSLTGGGAGGQRPSSRGTGRPMMIAGEAW